MALNRTKRQHFTDPERGSSNDNNGIFRREHRFVSNEELVTFLDVVQITGRAVTGRVRLIGIDPSVGDDYGAVLIEASFSKSGSVLTTPATNELINDAGQGVDAQWSSDIFQFRTRDAISNNWLVEVEYYQFDKDSQITWLI